MRPRVICYLFLLLAAFCFLMGISPGVASRKPIGRAIVQNAQTPSSEETAKIAALQQNARLKQYAYLTSGTALITTALVYGWHKRL